jgi:putative heme-binding domain-containing protein
VLPGFKVELLRSAEPGEGSWICLTVDDRGRFIISPQEDAQPLLRVTLSSEGKVAKIEPIAAPVRQAMGLLYAHQSLYVHGHGPQGTGLYRLIDANQDDQFGSGEIGFLGRTHGEGEHGYHAVVLGPDQMIYVMNGNHTKLPPGLSSASPHKNYAEDLLLPRQWDAGGHAVGILAPGGHILRTDPGGQHWELMLAGFRNAYDFDFNPDGEIFTFDSDMEWDWGMPWYRPVRINHCVRGGEYGWRSGTGKWPVWYPDSLPGTVDIGIGSPTGVKFGTRAKFPPKYQQALYVMDWSYGRIIAVHLKPQGASYTGAFETFVRGKPLNVTDLEIGRDGAMYFLTGGRGTQAGLYRVAYDGPMDPPPALSAAELHAAQQAAAARAVRRRLESFFGCKDPAAIDVAWPYLDSEDRWLRYSARMVLEWQDVSLWQQRALTETKINASLTALLALARVGPPDLQPALLQSLDRLRHERLSESQALEALRVLQLAFIRMGKPDQPLRESVIDALSPLYPSPSEHLNRELSQLLIYLEAPDVVSKSLALVEAAPTLEEQVHYLFHLRTLKTGWTLDQRRQYFHGLNRVAAGGAHPPEMLRWFRDAGREYSDGASFGKFIVNFRNDAVATLTEAERAELKPIIAGQAVAAAPAATGRQMVKEWAPEDLAPELDKVGAGRSLARGEAAFQAAQCVACHRFGNQGGSVGPDLTAVATRFSRRDLLESILLPSKVVSDQYQNTTFTLQDGEEVTGRLLNETDEKLVLLTNPLLGTEGELLKKDIRSVTPAKLSPMPEGLVNILSQEEILDLLAYLESGGRPAPAAAQ